MELEIQCRDCGRIRTATISSPIVPLIDGSYCVSNTDENCKCQCKCEAFYVVRFIKT
ncbi:hypothetical protein [Methanooceanicella nereidis]|uniref:hypothetical protein n=1 Tax=Methanooceanicella nereidis TaxID=2052831 RepID=UPI001E5156C8|nr:hypothetical protein [Methanocella sp. CWC-04]